MSTQEPKKHVHADLIIAWANGAKIQYSNGGGWQDCADPVWNHHGWYRIKPEPPWYKSIPEQGILCWVSDLESPNAYLALVKEYEPEKLKPFVTDFCGFECAKPVSYLEMDCYIYEPT